MNQIRVAKCASAVVALAICSACSGASAMVPSSSALSAKYVGRVLYLNGRPVTAERISPAPLFAQLVPDKQSKAKDYEYVSNDYGTYSSIFDYPKSDNEIGQISGDGGQGCTNVLYGYGKKYFWNVGGPTQITEYKVEKTPVKSLSIPNTFPTSCAMDTSGDLAVGLFSESGQNGGGGDVVIFKNATGPGKAYSTPLTAEYFDGYDDKGDLFADGATDNDTVGLVELAKGSSTFKTITLPDTISFPGSVQWDGKYITVFDQEANVTHQYTVSGTKATLVNTITYSGDGDCAQTWIVKGFIYCGDAGNGNGGVFKYPAGGSEVAALGSGLPTPLGVTAAEK